MPPTPTTPSAGPTLVAELRPPPLSDRVAFSGVARRGIQDNKKTAVDKVKKGKGRVVNERFATMCAHYLVDPDFCNVASGWEKG